MALGEMSRENKVTKLMGYFSPEKEDEHFQNQIEKVITIYH